MEVANLDFVQDTCYACNTTEKKTLQEAARCSKCMSSTYLWRQQLKRKANPRAYMGTNSALFASARNGFVTTKPKETRKRRYEVLVGYRATNPQVQNEICAICLVACEVGDDIYTTGCNHTYHTQCLNAWYQRKTTCPQCLAQIQANK